MNTERENDIDEVSELYLNILRGVWRFVRTTFKISIWGLVIGFFISFFIEDSVIHSDSENTESSIDVIVAGIIILLSPVIAGFLAWSERQDFLENRSLEINRLIDQVKNHRSALARNLEQAVKENDYGMIVKDNTDKELKKFFESIDLDANLVAFSKAIEIVFEQLEVWKKKDRRKGFDANTLPTEGHEFEHWVADGLKKYRWKTKVTSGSGDQGIDVIAKKNGKTVGLQCKLFSSPVGNKAVQEAHAGKAFHQMDVVGVISNASYTKSAKALATDTGVKLLSHHDIPNLYEKMFNE